MANFLDIIKGEGPAIAFIRSLVETESTASEILSKLSEEGLGIRRATGLQVINYLRGTVQPTRKYISSLTLNALPNVLRLPKNPLNQKKLLNYNVLLRGFSTLTGQLEEKRLTIASNTVLTKQQALDVAVQAGTGSFQSGGLDSATGSVEDIFYNPEGALVA